MEKIAIDRFDGNAHNFRQWKFQIKCTLRAKGLVEYLTKNIEWTRDDEWMKKNSMAMFIVTQCLDYELISLIETCNTTVEVMDKLECIYEQKLKLNTLKLNS